MSLHPVCCCSCYQYQKRFIVGGTNGQERDRSQVSDGKVKMMPRARLLLGCVLCVESIHPSSGVPCPPFIAQGEQGLQMGEKGKNQRVEKVLRRSRVFLSPCAYLVVMADRVRDGLFADPYRAMPWPHSASGYVPSCTDEWCGVLGSRAVTLRGVDGGVTIRPSL